MSRDDPFPALLRAFFYEWLVEQRNASIHTVRSYRDTWRLLLRFVAWRAGKKVAMITLADLNANESPRSPPPRRSLTWRYDRHAQLPPCCDPQLLPLRGHQDRIDCAMRRVSTSRSSALEPRSCAALVPLQQRRTNTGGARPVPRSNPISPNCVRLTGKGRKERICPLGPETGILQKKLLERQPRAPDQRLFVTAMVSRSAPQGSDSGSPPA